MVRGCDHRTKRGIKKDMNNQKLSSYIKAQLEQNKSRVEIEQELLNLGCQRNDVNKAFKALTTTAAAAEPFSPHTSFPQIASGAQDLDPKAVWYFFLRIIGPVVISTIILIYLVRLGVNILHYAADKPDTAWGTVAWGISLLILLTAIGLAFCWCKLSYKFYHYELTEEGFHKEYGVVVKKYMTIPYERIQNINIYRGILERIMGLSALRIFTAGTGGTEAEGVVPCLSKKKAEDIKNELAYRSRILKP